MEGMEKPLVVVLTQDLFFAEPIAQAVARAGGRALVVENARTLVQALAEHPVLVVIEMGRVEDGDWLKAIRQARGLAPDTPILAFGSHVDVAAREAARAAGSDEVWARSRFVKAFPGFLAQLLQSHEFACCHDPAPELVHEGVALFNQGAYYRCHDALEEAWRREGRPCRRLYQGILQLGIAIYQARRGNVRGAEKMFVRARKKFEGLPDRCQGVDVARLRTLTAQLQSQLDELPPDRFPQFPITPPHITIDHR